jgi:small subunit ribosomal protein S2
MPGFRQAGPGFNQRKIVSTIGIKELLEAGVHFGHQTKRWNPKMKPFIFDARNGIHIIDLSKTEAQLEAALNYLSNSVRKGGKILFVGTKKQAQQCVKETAKETGQMYVVERWLGGTLTNFATVKTSIKRLKEIEKWETDGTMGGYVKQEQAAIRREGARLNKYFDGLRELDKMPAAMFVVDVKREHNAVAEAKKLGIPVVALVDTNSDPDDADFPIAANDDAIRSVRLILGAVSAAITQARAEFESKKSRRVNEEAAPAPVEAAAPAPASAVAPATAPAAA